jgi:hypothetical protein
MRQMMKRRLEDAGLPTLFSPHSFRVTVVTDLLNQNVPLEDVQYLAGHASPTTTRVYDRRRRMVPAISSRESLFRDWLSMWDLCRDNWVRLTLLVHMLASVAAYWHWGALKTPSDRIVRQIEGLELRPRYRPGARQGLNGK